MISAVQFGWRRGMVMFTLVNQSGIETVWLVKKDGQIVGKVCKARGSKFPWRAYLFRPLLSDKLLGTYYPEEGGKDAAVIRVKEAVGVEQFHAWKDRVNAIKMK